jgi:hypothetical protein
MEYGESQKFNQWWLWLLNFVIFAALAVMGFNAWGEGVGVLTAAVGPMSMALVMILLATIELRTVITEDGLEVKFWPFGRRSMRPFANLEVGAIASDRVVRLLICRAIWASSSK